MVLSKKRKKERNVLEAPAESLAVMAFINLIKNLDPCLVNVLLVLFCFTFVLIFISRSSKCLIYYNTFYLFIGQCQGMGAWARISVNFDFRPPWTEIKICQKYCKSSRITPLRYQIYYMRAKKGYFSFSSKSYFR